jgi:hypothetical protein
MDIVKPCGLPDTVLCGERTTGSRLIGLVYLWSANSGHRPDEPVSGVLMHAFAIGIGSDPSRTRASTRVEAGSTANP